MLKQQQYNSQVYKTTPGCVDIFGLHVHIEVLQKSLLTVAASVLTGVSVYFANTEKPYIYVAGVRLVQQSKI